MSERFDSGTLSCMRLVSQKSVPVVQVLTDLIGRLCLGSIASSPCSATTTTATAVVRLGIFFFFFLFLSSCFLSLSQFFFFACFCFCRAASYNSRSFTRFSCALLLVCFFPSCLGVVWFRLVCCCFRWPMSFVSMMVVLSACGW